MCNRITWCGVNNGRVLVWMRRFVKASDGLTSVVRENTSKVRSGSTSATHNPGTARVSGRPRRVSAAPSRLSTLARCRLPPILFSTFPQNKKGLGPLPALTKAPHPHSKARPLYNPLTTSPTYSDPQSSAPLAQPVDCASN